LGLLGVEGSSKVKYFSKPFLAKRKEKTYVAKATFSQA
jgi:hypothetical protein